MQYLQVRVTVRSPLKHPSPILWCESCGWQLHSFRIRASYGLLAYYFIYPNNEICSYHFKKSHTTRSHSSTSTPLPWPTRCGRSRVYRFVRRCVPQRSRAEPAEEAHFEVQTDESTYPLKNVPASGSQAAVPCGTGPGSPGRRRTRGRRSQWRRRGPPRGATTAGVH